MLEELFTLENLWTLCFDLGLEYKNMGVDSKEGISREMVTEMWRCGRFWEFVEECRARTGRSVRCRWSEELLIVDC